MNDAVDRWAAQLTDDDAPVFANWVMRARSELGRQVIERRAAGSRAWTSELARVLAFGRDEEGWAAAADLLAAAPTSELTESDRVLLGQCLLRTGRRDEVAALLADDDAPLPAVAAWSLASDLANPAAGGPAERSTWDEWTQVFGQAFSAADLETPYLEVPDLAGDDESSFSPFARLRARPTETVDDPERVCVVVSAYNPDHDLLMSVRSLVDQSWTNLEILIVDDASPDPGAARWFDAARSLDPRVRVHRAEVNGGTYQARNIALLTSDAEWITFHDSDDFAHPRRIERQVEAVRRSKHGIGSRSWAIRAYSDLTTTYVGYPPNRLNASSLLFRRAPVLDLIGGFDGVRKSADMEYPGRLLAARPRSVIDLGRKAPLAVTQLRMGSLSRSDAVPGWTHWSRMAYRDAYLEWHGRIARGADPRHNPPTLRPQATPRPFAVPLPEFLAGPDRETARPRAWDVVVAGDFSEEVPAASVIDEITALCTHGLQVGIAHLERPDPIVSRRRPIAAEIQALINSGQATRVHLSEELRAEVVLVVDPAALELRDLDGSGWQVESVRVSARDEGGEGAALAQRASATAAALWPDAPVSVVPRDATVAAALADPDGVVPLLPAGPTRSFPRRPGEGRPVVGHHLPDLPVMWRSDLDRDARRRAILEVLPEGGSVDVRIASRSRSARAALGEKRLPPAWVGLGDHAGTTVSTFLAALDAFVSTASSKADPQVATAAIGAARAGAVVVLPERFAATLGDLALYAPEDQVISTITALWSDRDAWERQSRAGRSAAARLSADALTTLLGRSITKEPS